MFHERYTLRYSDKNAPLEDEWALDSRIWREASQFPARKDAIQVINLKLSGRFRNPGLIQPIEIEKDGW